MSTMQPALDGLSQIGEKVPPVVNLHGGRRTKRNAAGVFGRAVASDDGDAGSAREPSAQGRRSTIG